MVSNSKIVELRRVAELKRAIRIHERTENFIVRIDKGIRYFGNYRINQLYATKRIARGLKNNEIPIGFHDSEQSTELIKVKYDKNSAMTNLISGGSRGFGKCNHHSVIVMVKNNNKISKKTRYRYSNR